MTYAKDSGLNAEHDFLISFRIWKRIAVSNNDWIKCRLSIVFEPWESVLTHRGFVAQKAMNPLFVLIIMI